MKRTHIIAMTSGDEHDALTRWRHVYHWKPGARKAIKRAYNRRQLVGIRLELKGARQFNANSAAFTQQVSRVGAGDTPL